MKNRTLNKAIALMGICLFVPVLGACGEEKGTDAPAVSSTEEEVMHQEAEALSSANDVIVIDETIADNEDEVAEADTMTEELAFLGEYALAYGSRDGLRRYMMLSDELRAIEDMEGAGPGAGTDLIGMALLEELFPGETSQDFYEWNPETGKYEWVSFDANRNYALGIGAEWPYMSETDPDIAIEIADGKDAVISWNTEGTSDNAPKRFNINVTFERIGTQYRITGEN